MKPIQLSELVRPWQHELVAFSHLCASNTHRLLVDSGGTPRRENNSLGRLEERGGLLVLFSCTFFLILPIPEWKVALQQCCVIIFNRARRRLASSMIII